MTETERKYEKEFLQIAKNNGYCGMVCFTMGAFAFNKGTDEAETIKRLKDLIDLAKKYPKEDDFMEVFEEKCINK